MLSRGVRVWRQLEKEAHAREREREPEVERRRAGVWEYPMGRAPRRRWVVEDRQNGAEEGRPPYSVATAGIRLSLYSTRSAPCLYAHSRE